MKINAYFRLMRFHKPVGIVLLWLPIAWALWLANKGMPPVSLLLYFFAGTVCMRSAGCIINDIADRNIDKHVKRTHTRPLTSGEVSLAESLRLLLILLFIAFIIVLQLPVLCIYYSVLALLVTVIYPFCKRYIQAPQLMLGIAFCMGIPMVYAASGVAMDSCGLLLMLINFIWVVSYDTMYAMVDRKDDLQIGVKSTAILFAEQDCFVILLLQLALHGLWLFLAASLPLSPGFYLFWIIGGGVLAYHQRLVNTRQESSCFKAFTLNTWYGTLMWLALILFNGGK